MSLIPIVPPNTAGADLIATLNDRIRRINLALGESQVAQGGTTRIVINGTVQAAGTAPSLYGTHNGRLQTPTASVEDGTAWYETDRTVMYQFQAGGRSAGSWAYVGGAMRGLLANLPTATDLGAGDAGFRYDVADFGHRLRWSGTGWNLDDAPGGQVEHKLVHPWTHFGKVNVAAAVVTWVSGQKFDAQHGTPRILVNGAWCLVQSIDSATQITLTGAPGDALNVSYNLAIGWHYCDGKGDDNTAGTAVHFLRGDGTSGAIGTLTIPDLTAGAYLKLGLTYTGTVNAAVAPTISGDTGDTSGGTPSGTVSQPTLAMNSYTPAGTVSQPTLAMNSYTPAGTVSQPTFAGSALGTHQHALPFRVYGGNIYELPSFGSTGSYLSGTYVAGTVASNTVPAELDSAVSAGTPAGTVSQPTFTGTPATLTGTVSQPTFSGTPATLTGTVSQPTFTGNALAAHHHAVALTASLAGGDPVANAVAHPWFRK